MGGTDTEEMARFAMFDKSFDLLNLCNYEEGYMQIKPFMQPYVTRFWKMGLIAVFMISR